MSIAAQGLHMGDDVHIRLQGSTNLMLRDLLPHLAALEDPRRIDLARFLAGNHLFFLNVAMAAAPGVDRMGDGRARTRRSSPP